MTAAAEFGADSRGIIAGYRPDGHFGATLCRFPQGGRHADTGNGPGEVGNIVHIILGNTQFFLHSLGDGHNGHFALCQEPGVLHHPSLQPQPGQGSVFKQHLVQRIHLHAGRRTGCRHQEGVVRGVGEAEAAGIRGSCHIQRRTNGFIYRQPQFHQYIKNNLCAGASLWIHQFLRGEGSGCAVMINPQGNPVPVRLKGLGQHIGCRHIHADQGHIFFRRSHRQARMQECIAGCQLRIFQDHSLLAQLSQTQAQSSSGAGGITVRLAVGQDAVIIPLRQPEGSLIPRHHHA